MQHKNNIHPVPKFLTFYRSCPLAWAKNEYYSSRKHRYKITTINWNSVTNKLTGKKIYGYVKINIYEMTLEEFKDWSLGLHNEDIISIEKISE
jgi:hypothetical protein